MARAPDPEALGKIRNVVKSAHRWGGDGSKPTFRKIRRVLLAKHPEVIAKAFGGNANTAAAWIKNNWYRMRGKDVPPTRGPKALHATRDIAFSYLEVPAELMGGAELFCGAAGTDERDGLVWTNALRTGTWKVNPVAGATGPLVIDLPWLKEVKAAFDEGAWEHVTVPTSHRDGALENTGYVRALEIVPDPEREDRHLLRAGIGFTEPEAEARAKRGSVPGVSVNVKFNVREPESGKVFPKVLTHLALTPAPFVSGLKAFTASSATTTTSNASVLGSYLLDDEEAWIDVTEIAFTQEEMTTLLELAKRGERAFGAEVWDEERDYEYVRQQINAQLSKGYFLDAEGDLVERDDTDPALSPAYVWVKGMTPERVLVCAHGGSVYESEHAAYDAAIYNGEARGWVLGYEVSEDGEVTIDPIDEWVPVAKTWVELSLEFELGDPDMSLGWMPSSVSRADLDDGDFALVYIDSAGTKVRKLPYKIHGKVNDAGWRAAWAAVNGARGGLKEPSSRVATARKKLLRDKPKGIEVQMESADHPGNETLTLSVGGNPRGGDRMADQDENQITLTREDLDRIADERAQAVLQAYREEQGEENRRREEELAATRRTVHEMTVKERIAELNEAGHAPAVVAKAKEIMLADGGGEQMLSLSREGSEVQLTATDIVTELLSAIPATSLVASQIVVPANGDAPDDDEEARKNKLWDQLYDKDGNPLAAIEG